MGYNLSIGEFRVDIDHGERWCRGAVERQEIESAPLNSSENHSNMCHPSYSAWSRFAREVGLEDVFAWKELGSLIEDHPGVTPLTREHLARFQAARKRLANTSDPVWDRRRLEWLIWWTRWALENCEYPTFANS
jgi:hypothetical protein